MNPVKLIVSSKNNLKFKYGKNFSKIEQLLKKLQVADRKKGLDTRIVFIDDPVSAKRSKLKPVKTVTEQEAKRAVDDLYREYIPAYIVIFGAQDVIPFQQITNPAEDDDTTVPSDLPYACDAPFSRKIQNFTGPSRVVGRLPDIPGKQTDIKYFDRLVNNAINHQPLKADQYMNYFSVSAYVWRKSTELSLQSMFGHNGKMIVSPSGKGKNNPPYRSFTKKQLQPMTHFYNCHGGPNDLSFYGQKGSSYPEAFESVNLPANISAGTIVAAECCYGAQLIDPATTQLPAVSIANNYLGNDAIAFVGSSTIAYGPTDSQSLADLITQYFIKNILAGASSGRAFLEARQQFLTDSGPDLDPCELKTLAQFYLLGDPSVQPAECEEAETVTLSMGSAIINSRKNMSMKGESLSRSIGITKKLRVAGPLKLKMAIPNKTSMSVNDILKKNNFRVDKKAVYSVQPKVSGDAGIQKKFGGRKIKFHAFIQDDSAKHNRIRLRVLVVKENAAQILAWRVYESR